MTSNIHPTAIVDSGAKIADGVEIGAYAVIGNHVEIGAGTRIGSHTVISGPTEIGADNHIYQFASIGDEPQDKKYAGQRTKLKVGDRNTIREFCTVNRGTVEDRAITVIGNDNWLMAYVHIAHDCVLGDNIIMANNATLGGHVHVDDWVIFGGFTGVHQYCRVGAHAFLGMYASVSKDVPAYVMVVGQPGEPRGINSEGLKRRGFSADEIRNIKDAYKVIYRSGLKLAEAVGEISSRVGEQPELQLLLTTLERAGRSVLR